MQAAPHCCLICQGRDRGPIASGFPVVPVMYEAISVCGEVSWIQLVMGGILLCGAIFKTFFLENAIDFV